MADEDDDVNVYISGKYGEKVAKPSRPSMWDRVKEEAQLNSHQLGELDKRRAEAESYRRKIKGK